MSTSENHCRKVYGNMYLRLFYTRIDYVVQIIYNKNILDKRLLEEKRESREIIFRSKDRAEAVAHFNSTMDRLRSYQLK